jgi:hypothetical protein
MADDVLCRIVSAFIVGAERDAVLAGLRTFPVTFPYTNDLTPVSAATCSSNVIGILLFQSFEMHRFRLSFCS